MKRRILVAPAGSRFSPNGGSEDRVVYDIVAGMAAVEPNFEFTCLAEQVDGMFPPRVFPTAIGRRRTEELGGFLLPFRIARAANIVAPLSSVDLVHHALPFSVGRSFSLLAAQAHRSGLPVVIGPVQTPLEWTGPDEWGGQLEQRDAPGLLRAASTGATLTWPLAGIALSRLSAHTLRQADRVVVYVPAGQALVESVGVDPERIEVIPPPSWLCPSMPRRPAYSVGARRLVTAGYLIERKGIRDIVTTVAAVAKSGEDIVLDVAGDGPAATDLKELARTHGLSEVIHFHGRLERSKLAELLGAADAYVSMSRAESWGQAVAEALASGLVVIAAANLGALSMKRLGAPVRLVPLGDKRRLANELRRLCRTDRETLKRQGEDGAKWAAIHISKTVVAQRWANVYWQAIERTRAPKPVLPSQSVIRGQTWH